jgi:hypothetical protein
VSVNVSNLRLSAARTATPAAGLPVIPVAIRALNTDQAQSLSAIRFQAGLLCDRL